MNPITSQEMRGANEAPRIYFNKIADERGNLFVAEVAKQLPFVIQRVFFINHVPANATRGGHAHLQCSEVVVPICGSFVVT